MTVHVHRDGAVVIATLDRPERRNAVDAATLRSLLEVQGDMTRLADEHPDRAARVLVITGAAPAFSAVADLTGVDDAANRDARAWPHLHDLVAPQDLGDRAVGVRDDPHRDPSRHDARQSVACSRGRAVPGRHRRERAR